MGFMFNIDRLMLTTNIRGSGTGGATGAMALHPKIWMEGAKVLFGPNPQNYNNFYYEIASKLSDIIHIFKSFCLQRAE